MNLRWNFSPGHENGHFHALGMIMRFSCPVFMPTPHLCSTVQYEDSYSQPWLSNQTGSTNFSRVLAYSRNFFHPDPCSGMAKKHIFGRNEKTRRRVFPQSEHDREVHCSDQTAASQDIPPRRFPALGGKHDRRRARARAMWGPCYYVWVILKRTFLGV